MIVIENDLDFDILIFPEEIARERHNMFGTIEAYRLNKDKPLKLEGIAKNTGKKIILEYVLDNRPSLAKPITGRREGEKWIFTIYEDMWKFEFENSSIHRGPLCDRYDWENKARIYSAIDLDSCLKSYFGISELLSGEC